MVDVPPPATAAEPAGVPPAGTPFLAYRERDGAERRVLLSGELQRLTVGRADGRDILLDDPKVSRLHAALERIGRDWTVVDDGLSRNGTFVNDVRLSGRRRLHDGDRVRVGGTTMTFHAPREQDLATAVADDVPSLLKLSDAQRRVLVALCRPYKHGRAYAMPATNQQIADELFLSVDAVKTHLRALFAKFDVEELPQNQKRARLVERAFAAGMVTEQDL
jgi:pSer/pThr/pTyr-binding forkhead associated (FHA) protein